MPPLHKQMAVSVKRIVKDKKKKRGTTNWAKYVPTVVSEYLQSTSIYCLRYLQYPDSHPLIRISWGLVFVACFTGAVVSSVRSYYNFLETPLVMSVETSSYHTSNVHFPAVAVCNVNKMLRSKVWQLAQRLSQGTNVSEVAIFDYLKNFGNVYNARRNNFEIEELHKILVIQGQANNITAILEELAPKCENLLKKCTWKGVTAPCSEYFKPLLTIDNGFCCIFNHHRNFELLFPEYYNSTNSKQPETPKVEFSALGISGGLSVELDLETNEYFYTELPTTAANVLVFSALSIQDSENGNALENLVPLDTEVFLRLETAVTYSDSRIEKWPPSKRKCDFSFEQKEYVGGYYSYPSCLVACRTRNVTSTCGCLPIFMPKKNEGDIIPYCNLSDLPCLNSHKAMWSKDPVGQSEDNGCNCRPACDREHYSLRSWNSQLTSVDKKPLNFGMNETKNSAMFHIFLGNAHTTRYKKDILLQESNLFNNLAGLCSLFLGCSFMSVAEIIYFFLIRPLCNKYVLKRNNRFEKNNKIGTVHKTTKRSKKCNYRDLIA